MDHLVEADTLPGAAQPWHSQTSEPDSPVTNPHLEEAENDMARIQSLRAPTEIAAHRLPAEIWIAVCDALRRLDLIDATTPEKIQEKVYPERNRWTTGKNRPDRIITAVSILPLSQTCRYLHKVTSAPLLETIRVMPPSHGDGNSRYLSVIQQAKSLHLNGDQRLQHVRGFAVALPDMYDVNTDHKNDLRNRIRHLLTRAPNLRHLTVINMALDAPLMQNILTLPLEHLWLWYAGPENPIPDHTFTLTTTPKLELLSLVLQGNVMPDQPSIPMSWISQLIGTAMQDMLFDTSALVPPFLPVLPDLEVFEGPSGIRFERVNPSMLCGILSKTPNLKEADLRFNARQEYLSNMIPALSHLERIVCHPSWLRLLIPGRPITTVHVSCDSRVKVQELFKILDKGSVPLRDLTLTYAFPQRWSPDDLEPISRYLPELEILRLWIQDSTMDGLQEALLYISQLKLLRIVSFVCFVRSSLPDDVWQESRLREFLGVTKSPVLEEVSFVGKFEWKLQETGVWILWEGGRMVRSVSL